MLNVVIAPKNCVFEHVANLRESLCEDLFGAKLEYVEMPNVNFAETLFADDTLMFASQGPSMDVLLWATEAVSGVYGLGLNRDKCVKMSIKHVANMVFSNDEEVGCSKKRACRSES